MKEGAYPDSVACRESIRSPYARVRPGSAGEGGSYVCDNWRQHWFTSRSQFLLLLLCINIFHKKTSRRLDIDFVLNIEGPGYRAANRFHNSKWETTPVRTFSLETSVSSGIRMRNRDTCKRGIKSFQTLWVNSDFIHAPISVASP
jgi:hypothetical protein